MPTPGHRVATEVSIESLATPTPEANSVSSSTPVRAEVQPESPALEQKSEPEATSDAAANPTATPEPTPTNTRVVLPGGLPSGREPGNIVVAEFLRTFQPAGNYNVDLYRLHYLTFDQDDRPTVVRANIYIPRPTGSETLPILVYGGGTTGLGAACAPLDELARGGNWGSYHYQMLAYSAQGFITVWPEWQGYDQTGLVHPFFLAEPQARTMLDSARAVYRFLDEPQAAELSVAPQEAVFLGGYSSGGHAAFAAKDLAGRYAPELSIRGVFGHGPTTDPETLLIESPIFSPYLVYAYSTALGPDVVEPNRVFQDRWLASFEADVTTRCVDNIFAYYSFSSRQMYRPEFREALATGGLQGIAPAFKRALEANSAGLSPHGTDIPILILQGTADTVVTPGSQQAFAAGLCQLGHRVTYNSYPAVSHADTRHVSFRDTIAWLNGVADGGLPESNCGSLISP